MPGKPERLSMGLLKTNGTQVYFQHSSHCGAIHTVMSKIAENYRSLLITYSDESYVALLALLLMIAAPDTCT